MYFVFENSGYPSLLACQINYLFASPSMFKVQTRENAPHCSIVAKILDPFLKKFDFQLAALRSSFLSRCSKLSEKVTSFGDMALSDTHFTQPKVSFEKRQIILWKQLSNTNNTMSFVTWSDMAAWRRGNLMGFHPWFEWQCSRFVEHQWLRLYNQAVAGVQSSCLSHTSISSVWCEVVRAKLIDCRDIETTY